MELDKRITIRLSETEHKKLVRKAEKKGVTLSVYIRAKLSKDK
jgi:predicted DNA binding CopG/RHH family protein